MKKLGVNIDHVATLRQQRGTRYPDPVAAASLAESAGADQITIHLREDRRHIQDYDLATLRKTVGVALNLEMAATAEMVRIACAIKPDTVTLVPERRAELTTEGGLNVTRHQRRLRKMIETLQAAQIRVSLFLDPDLPQIAAARALGVEAVELHTGRYCAAMGATAVRELIRLQAAMRAAQDAGLYVAAGHGLHYENIRAVVKALPDVAEYNIGHSLVARAIFVGLAQAVREMRRLIDAPEQRADQ